MQAAYEVNGWHTALGPFSARAGLLRTEPRIPPPPLSH